MGIVNVTSDSFSDGGLYASTDAAIAHARSLMVAGAAVVDVGGESTRPGSAGVDLIDELSRVIPVIEALAADDNVLVSVDTCKPAVAQAATRQIAVVAQRPHPQERSTGLRCLQSQVQRS